MKKLRIPVVLFCLAFSSCDKTSSPEGRMSIKLDSVYEQIDSLKMQNRQILDSLARMSEELKALR